MKLHLHRPEPTSAQLLLIIVAAARRGRRIGGNIAARLFDKRATAQATHDHYTGAQSRAAKRRMASHLRCFQDADMAKGTHDYLRSQGQRTSRHLR